MRWGRNTILFNFIFITVINATFRTHTCGVRIKSHYLNPRLVSYSTSNDPPFKKRPHRHKVILTSCDNVLAIWTPANTIESSKKTLHHTTQRLQVKVKNSQKAILICGCNMFTVRRKGKLIYSSLSNGPFTNWVPRGFWFATIYCIARSLFHKSILRRSSSCWMLLVINKHVPTFVSNKKQIFRSWNPFETHDFGFIHKSLRE